MQKEVLRRQRLPSPLLLLLARMASKNAAAQAAGGRREEERPRGGESGTTDASKAGEVLEVEGVSEVLEALKNEEIVCISLEEVP